VISLMRPAHFGASVLDMGIVLLAPAGAIVSTADDLARFYEPLRGAVTSLLVTARLRLAPLEGEQ
jgi:hypothetical protein